MRLEGCDPPNTFWLDYVEREHDATSSRRAIVALAVIRYAGSANGVDTVLECTGTHTDTVTGSAHRTRTTARRQIVYYFNRESLFLVDNRDRHELLDDFDAEWI